jgi:hypothetical protein
LISNTFWGCHATLFNDHGCGYPVFGQINHKLNIKPMAEETQSKDVDSPAGLAFGAIAFGAYFLGGSYYGFAHAKWPFFMPPQLDIFGFLFELFGQKIGGYVGGGLLGILGLALVILGVTMLVKSDV